MSGSAKKRREKARRKCRRARALVRRLGEMERRSAAAHAAFTRLVDMPHDRVPGFIHDIEFAAFTDPTRHIYAGG